MGKIKIAYGSCVRYEAYGIDEQPVWDAIAKEDPDHLFLLGDQVYMDFGLKCVTNEYKGKPESYTPDKFERVLELKYLEQWKVPNFTALIEKMRSKPDGFHAVWDDHDFAWNNAKGATLPEAIKQSSLKLFGSYLYNDPKIRQVHRSFEIGGLAKVIMLDQRLHAQKPTKTSSILGKEQFAWFEKELQHDLPYTVICAGLTLCDGAEHWSAYTDEYAKFCKLVEGRKGVVYLSGDIHQNKFNKPGKRRSWKTLFLKPVKQPCFEATSSGIANKLIGLPCGIDQQQNYGILELEEHGMQVKLVDHRKKRSKTHTLQWS